MADEKEKTEKAQEEAKPKKSKMLIIIIAVVAVVVIGGGAFFFLKGDAFSNGDSGADTHEASAEKGNHGGGHKKKDPHGEGEAVGSSYVALDPFIVNLQDNSGTRYLKLTVNLEMASGSDSAELETQQAKIRDSLIILLSSKSYSDIGTVEGKYKMRDEIVTRVNQYLKSSEVQTAYFTEFVIQ